MAFNTIQELIDELNNLEPEDKLKRPILWVDGDRYDISMIDVLDEHFVDLNAEV